jgi:hypothetical protein
MMQRFIALSLGALLVSLAPAFAVSPQEKMQTCNFGADYQKLAGAARKKFMSRCMANADAPRRRAKTQQAK